ESSWPERTANAINCRYTTINRETCLQQILNRQESERTIEEKTNDAHILFKEMDLKKKKPFTLMHCYVEFSKYPKRQTREVETSLKKQKKTIDASPGTATNDPADASSVRTDATSIRTDALEHEKRPDGVKRDKRGKADESACKLSLETVWAAKQEKDEIKEAPKN
uniref:No apical meristem-associated C-terminal domain-containing protein n=1 Tax=Aegilops tauschii subsp. strangulata TaxID=200361 RepID=A0A452XD42_AEGTS